MTGEIWIVALAAVDAEGRSGLARDVEYGAFMTTRDQVVAWARDQADQLQSGMRFQPADGQSGGFWLLTDRSQKGLLMARVASALELLREHAGEESEWLNRAKIAYESNGDRASMESGVRAVGDIMRLWADQVESGMSHLPARVGEGIRALATTDIMEQVRVLNSDREVHPASSIVLAGAALETALRGAVEQFGLTISSHRGIAAYSQALRRAKILNKQDVKDLEQMAGLRNAAAHGELDTLSSERAGLMEQQVNMFLARLRDLADTPPSQPA